MRLLLATLLVLITATATGQSSTISGQLLDASTGEALRGAHVYLLDQSGSTVTATISDGTGAFEINRIDPGTYTLRFTYVGYEKLEKEVRVAGQDVTLGEISLNMSATALEEARVTVRVPMATQIGDTTQFNAGAFTTMPDASAEDLVEKMPGVVVEDGKVEAMGEEVEQVLVDGRPFFRNDPTAALRTLPSEVIDKIQIFDKESDQAEFTGFSNGETQKTMNIITRIGMRNGVFGKVHGGIGLEDDVLAGGLDDSGGSVRYMAGGNINFFNGPRRITLVGQTNNVNEQNFSSEDLMGVMASGTGRRQSGGRSVRGGGMRPGSTGGGRGGLGGPGAGNISDFIVAAQPGITTTHSFGVNYSDLWGKKVDVTGSYFFNYSDNHAVEDLHRLYTVGADSGQVYDETSTSDSRNINHRFNMRLEYNLDENNTIFIRPRLTVQQNDGTSFFSGETFSRGSLLNMLENSGSSDLQALNFSNTLLYRHRFAKERRTISVNASTRINRQDGVSYLESLTGYYTGRQFSEELDQHSMLNADGWTFSGNLMYTEPVGENGMAQLNYMASYKEDDSDKQTYNYNLPALDYTDLDTMLSSVFHNNYITQRAGAGYMYRKNNLFMTGRLEFQHAALYNEQIFPSKFEMSKSYRDLLVTAIMRYRPSRSNNLSLVYRTNTRPPSISQLQNVVDNSNTVQLETGNPGLEQTYSHSLFARYSSVKSETSRVFFAMLYGGISRDYIANHTIHAARDTLLEGGLLLKQGSQLIMPVNLDGYRSLRSFVTYGIPVNPIRSNLNFNLGYTYARIPGMVNHNSNFGQNHTATGGLVVSSNISEYLDFTFSSRTGYNLVSNSSNTLQDYTYFSQRTRFRFKGVLPESGFLLESLLTHRLTSGLSESYDQNNWIWSASVGKKLFANRLGEIKLGIYDLLNQSQSITRNVGDIYVEDTENNVLRRYFMLTFTYNLRQFEAPPEGGEEIHHHMMRIRREMD